MSEQLLPQFIIDLNIVRPVLQQHNSISTDRRDNVPLKEWKRCILNIEKTKKSRTTSPVAAF